MLLGNLKRIRLACDPNAIQGPIVHTCLDARDDSIASLMREDASANGHLVYRDDPGIRGDRHSCREADSAGDARLLADRGLRGLRINPDDFRPGALRWAEGVAFEMAALRLTPILEHDRDAHDEFDEP